MISAISECIHFTTFMYRLEFARAWSSLITTQIMYSPDELFSLWKMTQQCDISSLCVITALKCFGLQGHVYFIEIDFTLIMFFYIQFSLFFMFVWKQSLGN